MYLRILNVLENLVDESGFKWSDVKYSYGYISG